jgi:hypothetical protein
LALQAATQNIELICDEIINSERLASPDCLRIGLIAYRSAPKKLSFPLPSLRKKKKKDANCVLPHHSLTNTGITLLRICQSRSYPTYITSHAELSSAYHSISQNRSYVTLKFGFTSSPKEVKESLKSLWASGGNINSLLGEILIRILMLIDELTCSTE